MVRAIASCRIRRIVLGAAFDLTRCMKPEGPGLQRAPLTLPIRGTGGRGPGLTEQHTASLVGWGSSQAIAAR